MQTLIFVLWQGNGSSVSDQVPLDRWFVNVGALMVDDDPPETECMVEYGLQLIKSRPNPGIEIKLVKDLTPFSNRSKVVQQVSSVASNTVGFAGTGWSSVGALTGPAAVFMDKGRLELKPQVDW